MNKKLKTQTPTKGKCFLKPELDEIVAVAIWPVTSQGFQNTK